MLKFSRFFVSKYLYKITGIDVGSWHTNGVGTGRALVPRNCCEHCRRQPARTRTRRGPRPRPCTNTIICTGCMHRQTHTHTHVNTFEQHTLTLLSAQVVCTDKHTQICTGCMHKHVLEETSTNMHRLYAQRQLYHTHTFKHYTYSHSHFHTQHSLTLTVLNTTLTHTPIFKLCTH